MILVLMARELEYAAMAKKAIFLKDGLSVET